MRTKLTISVILLVILTLAFIYNAQRNDTTYMVENIGPNDHYTLTADEQNKRLEYLLSGKTEKYECERDFMVNETGSVIKDTSEFGKGAYVMCCNAASDKPGYIVRDAKKQKYEYSLQNNWMNDTAHNWYIKPSIRINRNFILTADHETRLKNLQAKICRLEVVNTEGKVIRETEYQGKHFCQKCPGEECSYFYTGNYMEGYGFLFDDAQERKSYTVINGKELNPDALADTKNTGLDYRIYWYGNTDIWVDYILVENDVSAELAEGKFSHWFVAMRDIDLTGLSKIKINPDQSLYYRDLINKACGIGITAK